MERLVSEVERDILRTLDAAITQIESQKIGKTRRGPVEKEVLSMVTEIISGEYRGREFRLELYAIVGLALSGTRYMEQRRKPFLRAWKSFLLTGDEEQGKEFLGILRRMRDDVSALGIALSGKDIDIGVAMYYDFFG
jgi:hypothetical protein